MGELWERSQKALYEKVGNYKYLQVFIQVPSTVHWWNMAWMQMGVRGKTSDLNVTGLISLVWTLTSFISLGWNQRWAKSCISLTSALQITGLFSRQNLAGERILLKAATSEHLETQEEVYLHKGGWMSGYLESWCQLPFCFPCAELWQQSMRSLCFSPTTPTSLHH